MKTWTYLEAKNKIITDLDLADLDFITQDELSGYFNDALQNVSAKIYDTNQDGYLLSRFYMPGVQGQSKCVLPDNIFATKIRHIIYANGSIIYDVRQYRRKAKFLDIALTDQYGTPDDYRYLLRNDYPGQSYVEFHPVLRESATVSTIVANQFAPLKMDYYRLPNRVPIIGSTGVGEFCNSEIIAPSQISTVSNEITTQSGTSVYGIKSQWQPGCFPGSIAYVTGDAVQVAAGYGDALPTPLAANTTYYVIAKGSGVIQLASSYANAIANTPITITGNCSIFMEMKVAATQNIVNATLIDIPEFAPYIIQKVKCRCLPKDGDPRLEAELAELDRLEVDMIASLTNSIPDDDDEIQGDFSIYREHS